MEGDMGRLLPPEVEKQVVALAREVLPEAVVSRAQVQEALLVANQQIPEAAELLTTNPVVVLHWKIMQVVLRVKAVLKYAWPYVHEYASAFEASGGDVEGCVTALLNDSIITRRNCEAEVRWRIKRCRQRGECFGHYTFALPTKDELSGALNAASPDTNAVVERLNHSPEMKERETKAQQANLLYSMQHDLYDKVTGNSNHGDTDSEKPIFYSRNAINFSDFQPALQEAGALERIAAHVMVDKFNMVRKGLLAPITDACMDKAVALVCTGSQIVQREMSYYCRGRHAVFPFKHAAPSEGDLADIFAKVCPPGLDLRDATGKQKAASAMSMALWKLPHLVKQETICETRPRFEFVHPTAEEFESAYKQVCGIRVPGRNEIGTMAAAIDKTLMKLSHIGPPETRGRLLKQKFYEVLSKLREMDVIDYSDQSWNDHNPTWEEFKTAFEGPGADNVERTIQVLKELPTVLQREAAEKETMMWTVLWLSVQQEVKILPNRVLFHTVSMEQVRRVFEAQAEGLVPLVEVLQMMPKRDALLKVVRCLRGAWIPIGRIAEVIESDGMKTLLLKLGSHAAADGEIWAAEEEARSVSFHSAFQQISKDWTKKTGRKYYVEERPSRAEILEAMCKTIEEGNHDKQGTQVEMYFSLRRANFIKGFAKLEKQNAQGCEAAAYQYKMSATKTGWWDVSMPYQACLVCGTVCLNGKPLGEATWDNSLTKEHGYSGMMVESIGLDYHGTTQVPTMADGTFQVMAQHSSKIHIRVMSEFAEEEYGPYDTEETGVIMSIGRFNIVHPEDAWPTVLQPKR